MSAAGGSEGLSPEIARLSAQILKDPKSKLFIPLAEEYMKEGLVEEAIMTLDDGLKHNPGYMSARVMLGKAYLQKGDVDNACTQFEAVVKAVPDNLFAHKKLGEIYVHQQRREEAMKSYNILSMLSPGDEDARSVLKTLESGIMPESTLVLPKSEEEESSVEAAPEEAKAEEAPAAPPPPEMDPFAAEEEQAGQEFDIEDEVADAEEDTAPVFEIDAPGPEDAQEDEEVSGGDMPGEPVHELGGEGEPEEEEISGPGFELEADTSGGGPGFGADARMKEILSEYEEGEPSTPGESSDNVYELPDEISGSDMGGFGIEETEAPSGESPFGMEAEAAPEPGAGEDIFGAAPEPGTGEDIFGAAPEPETGEDIFGAAPEEESPFGMAAEPVAEAETGEDIFGAVPEPETGEDIFGTAPEPEAGEDIFGSAPEPETGEDIFGTAPAEDESPFGMAAEPVAEPEAGEDIFGAAPAEDESPFGMAAEADVMESEPELAEVEAEPFAEEEEEVSEPGAKEPFSTDALAEMYIQQGFYDRAIKIYKEMLAESPGNEYIGRKLEDLYVLAGMDSTVKAEEAEGEGPGQAYEPVDFDSIPPDDQFSEVSVAAPSAPEAVNAAGGPGAVVVLEKFLDNIRKRSGR